MFLLSASERTNFSSQTRFSMFWKICHVTLWSWTEKNTAKSNHSLSYKLESERISERANEWAVRANEKMDQCMAQYFHLDSWFFWTIVASEHNDFFPNLFINIQKKTPCWKLFLRSYSYFVARPCLAFLCLFFLLKMFWKYFENILKYFGNISKIFWKYFENIHGQRTTLCGEVGNY